jgi:hypothetical protein
MDYKTLTRWTSAVAMSSFVLAPQAQAELTEADKWAIKSLVVGVAEGDEALKRHQNKLTNEDVHVVIARG